MPSIHNFAEPSYASAALELKSALLGAAEFGLSGEDGTTTVTASASSDATLTTTYIPPADDANVLCQSVHGWGDAEGGVFKVRQITLAGQTVAWGGPCGIEFLSDAPRIQVKIVGANTQTVTAIVNGRYVTASAALPHNTSYVVLDFGSDASLKRICVSISDACTWPLISVGAAYTVIPAPRRPRIGFIGDSVVLGTGAVPRQKGYAFLLSHLLGVNALVCAWGGTGYVSTNEVTYRPRIATDIVPRNPAVKALLFQCSTNDSGQSHAAQLAEAQATWTEARESFPGVPIIHIGSIQCIDNSGTVGLQQEVAFKSAFEAWARGHEGPALFIRTTPLWRVANNGLYADGGTSTPHRTTAGYAYLARYVASEIRNFIYSL